MAQDPFFNNLRILRDETLNNDEKVLKLKNILKNSVTGPDEIAIDLKELFGESITEDQFLETFVAEWLTRNDIKFIVLYHDRSLKLYIYFHNI